MPIEIMPNLWQVGGANLTGSGDANSYLIRFGNRAALIDAGCGDGHAKLIANIEACLSTDTTLATLLLTHCHFDHTGGAAAVREKFGCSILAHELDAAYLENGDSNVTAASWYGTWMTPLSVDIKLSGENNTIAIGDGQIEAIHWPGHSPGSLVFTARLGSQLILFGQDIHGPIHPALRSDRVLYQRSLRTLLDLDADLLLEGHYGIYRGKAEVINFIRSFIS